MNTARVISVEGYKATRSRIWLASLLIATLAPLLMGLGLLLRRANMIQNGSYTWQTLEQNALFFFSVMLAAAMVAGLAALALPDESRFNTLKSVLTSGITRSQYYFGKLLFVGLWVIVEMLIFSLTILLIGFGLGLNDPHLDKFALLLLVETAGLLALVPFFGLIAALSNNFFVTAGIGVGIAFITLLLTAFGGGRQYVGFFPGSAPTAFILLIENQFGSPPDQQPLAWGITLASFALVCLVLGWWVVQKRDIQ